MPQLDRRSLLGSIGAAGLALPLARPFAALAQTPADPGLAAIHPDLRPFVSRIRAFSASVPPLSRENLAERRVGMDKFTMPPRKDVPWERRTIRGAKGQPEVSIIVVNAQADASRPAILHTHGGGFVMGSAQGAVRMLQDLCRQLDCLAISVDYRLAPETTWRGSLDDNHAALAWLHGNAAPLGADPTRIGLLGESAGGGHAALLAIAARDRGEVPVAFQCLVYPMLDDRTGSSRPVPGHLAPVGWTAAENRLGWECYLGMAPGTRRVPTAAVPARTSNLAGLPPTWIGVGGLDLFVEEDIDYARRLTAAGVATELIVVPGAFHGFDGLPSGAPVSAWFNAAKLDALRRGLGVASSTTDIPGRMMP